MSRFVSNTLKTIDLGNDEWVKIPSAISYRLASELTGLSEVDMSKKMLLSCVKEWNLKDENGVVPEINEDSILSLDMDTVKLLSDSIGELFKVDQDKKK